MAVNRRLVIGGLIIGGGGIVAWEIYKYEKNKSAANAATTSAAESAVAASGYGYGYGYGSSAGYGYGYSGVTYGYGASGGFPAGYYGYGVPTPPSGGSGSPPVAATTNAQWDQAAITQLEQDGYDPATVSGALGAYLNGQQVDSSQVNIIDAAIGIEGYPPVAGASGYPPAIKQGGTPGGGSGGGQGGTTTVKIPSVVGDRAEPAKDKIRGVGLKVAQTPAPVPGHEQIVTSQSPAAGKSVNKGSLVTLHVRTK